MTGALGSGSTTRPPLSQPWARALPLLLGSGPSPFEATRQPSKGRPEAEDLRPNPLSGTAASCTAWPSRRPRPSTRARPRPEAHASLHTCPRSAAGAGAGSRAVTRTAAASTQGAARIPPAPPAPCARACVRAGVRAGGRASTCVHACKLCLCACVRACVRHLHACGAAAACSTRGSTEA